MIIKPPKFYIFEFAFYISTPFLVCLCLDLKVNGLPVYIALIAFLLIFLPVLVILIAHGRTFEFSELGCTVSFLWFKKTYKWSDIVVKAYMSCENVHDKMLYYKFAAVFSARHISNPITLHPGNYAFLHPWSFIYVYLIDADDPKREGVSYEADRSEFLSKLEEWGVTLDEWK